MPNKSAISSAQRPSLIRRLSMAGTMLDTWLNGVRVGSDAFGNVYYQAKRASANRRAKRWVIYAGEPDASFVPPEWHGWLHYTFEKPLSPDSIFHKDWQIPHQPNMTGTAEAYLPQGHDLSQGSRPPATGDYEAWKPE